MRVAHLGTSKAIGPLSRLVQKTLAARFCARANQCLSMVIKLAFYGLQYLAAPILASRFKSILQDGQRVDYSQYGTEAVTKQMTQILSRPIQLPNGVFLPNRLVKSGVTDGLCDPNGNPTSIMHHVYKKYGEGGYGMVIISDVSVDRDCRLPGLIGHASIFDHSSDPLAYQTLAQNIHKMGSVSILELTHPGPAVPFADIAYAPCEMVTSGLGLGLSQYTQPLNDQKIDEIIEMFLVSAKQAEEWGFSGIQIVAANGYLPALFLNRYLNHQEGKWKNDQFIITLIQRLIQNRSSPNFIIGIKLGSLDLQQGGYPPDEAAQVVEKTASQGVDFIEIVGGNCESVFHSSVGLDTPNDEGGVFFQDFANRVFASQFITIPIIATGGWRCVERMGKAAEQCPFLCIGLGRPTCIDPRVGNNILNGKISSIPDWFQVHLPSFIKKQLENNPTRGKKMACGVETMWHALAVLSLALGKAIPKVNGIFNASQNALAVKVYILIRNVLPLGWLSKWFSYHPSSLSNLSQESAIPLSFRRGM